MSEIPRSCPKCGAKAWDIIGDPMVCRATAGAHDWSMGVDRYGMPHLDVDQICRACGAMPVMDGVTH